MERTEARHLGAVHIKVAGEAAYSWRMKSMTEVSGLLRADTGCRPPMSTLATRTDGSTNPSQVAFVNGANETAATATTPISNATYSTTFDNTTFIGAVRPADTWYKGWTCSPLIGEEAC